jgi:hypothetical protein
MTMSKVFERIARENFRSSGYLSQPGRETRSSWTYTTPPRSPFSTTDSVHDALQRRERALLKTNNKTSSLHHWIHVLFHR